MKILTYTLLVLLGITEIPVLHADEAAMASRVEVTFSDSDNFTDAAEGARGTSFGRTAILNSLRAYLMERADEHVADGQKLTITVTDVDLAGEVEPWRSHQTRVIRSVYPPVINLTFKLIDSRGVVLKEGARHLRDLAFDQRLYLHRGDPRVYEKGLIDDWLRAEFNPANQR